MIYLDHNATTPIMPEVLEAMMPYLTSEWGNPSSTYKFGSKLKTVIETARKQVAELVGAYSRDIIFTSCATESNNAAIHAALKANPSKKHIVASAVEHSSVLNYCRALPSWLQYTLCRSESKGFDDGFQGQVGGHGGLPRNLPDLNEAAAVSTARRHCGSYASWGRRRCKPSSATRAT